jgi:hypothetical protein
VWFTPFVLVALFALHREREPVEEAAMEEAHPQPAVAVA